MPATAPAPTRSTATSANTVGAATPRLALESFLAAVRAQDLQAMSLIWGNKDGPVRDSKVFTREEMEQRELILIRCLTHDRYRILNENPGADGERVIQAELTRGTTAKPTDFYVAKGGSRWFIRSANIQCAAK
jgi:hypothetical protein